MGGSPGPSLLGYTDPLQAPVIDRPTPGVVIRERAGHDGWTVQGFDWGGLNSDSRFQALWVFLLPFTVLNAAGWAIPRPRAGAHGKLTRAMQLMVVVLGWVLTAATALWVSDLLIGYLGYQWLPRALGATGGASEFNLFGTWHVTVTLRAAQWIGIGIGTFVSIGLFVAALVLAGRAAAASREPTRHRKAFDRGVALSDPDFFDRRASWAAWKHTHLVISFVAIAIVAVHAVRAVLASPSKPSADAGTPLVIAGGVELLLLGVLAGIAVAVWAMRRESGPGVALSFAAMSFALTNMFFSGVVVWGTKYLSTHPPVSGRPNLAPGNELAIVDGYFWVALLWGLIGGFAWLYRTHLSGLPESCPPGAAIRPEWIKPVKRAQGTARIMHKVDRVTVALATVFVAVGVVLILRRAGVLSGEPPWDWTVKAPNQSGLAYTAVAWLLPAFVVVVMLRVRKAASDNRTRRFFGQLWDVLAFWPRRFQPFAVRPYTHIAVPALRDHLARRLDEGPVVVSAHSEGSILAVAALSQLEDRSRVGLLTYGSPVGTLHRRAFGSCFDEEQMRELLGHLGGEHGARWVNLYRFTDPVGGPIFRGSLDHCVPDPATATPDPLPDDPPLERDREPWTDLAIHSYYFNEPELKARLHSMKDRLDAPPAGPAPEAAAPIDHAGQREEKPKAP